jgi:hypothetical protein
MPSRFVAHALLATLAVGGIAFAADALVETDEEQLGQLVEDLTEGASGARVDAVLRWTDLSREAVAVGSGRAVVRFEEQDDHALAEELGEALAPFMTGGELEVVQRTVQVQGDRATVAVRVRADGQLHDASFRLTRNGQGWLVTDVRTHGT